MGYYPKNGDVDGWFAWFREKNAGCSDEQATEGVLRIFESSIWCQRSELRVLRQRALRDENAVGRVIEATHALGRTMDFLNGDTPQHRSFTFKQYREKLRRSRVMYDIHNDYPQPYPYDEIEMEVTRSTRQIRSHQCTQ
jgi:hypothetical protein